MIIVNRIKTEFGRMVDSCKKETAEHSSNNFDSNSKLRSKDLTSLCNYVQDSIL